MSEYIVNQICLNLKNELSELVSSNNDIYASDLLTEVTKYLKNKNVRDE